MSGIARSLRREHMGSYEAVPRPDSLISQENHLGSSVIWEDIQKKIKQGYYPITDDRGIISTMASMRMF